MTPNHRVKNGLKTQFKVGHKLQKLGKPWSIRNELSYLSAQEIDPQRIDEELQRLMKRGSLKGKKSTSLARLVAVRMFEKVIKKMDADLVNKLIENIEGKLVQPVDMNATNVTLNADFDNPEQAMKAFQSLL